MADGEILYIVKADNKQAVDALNKVQQSFDGVTQKTKQLAGSTQSSNMLLQSTGRIVQDLPYGFMAVGNNITFMAEQMGYMRSQGMSLKDMLVGMGKSFMGPMGIIFLISAATSALTYFTNGMGKGKSAVDDFTSSIDKSIKKLIEFRDPLKNLKFGLDPDQLNKLIPAIEKEIKALEDVNKQRQISIGVKSGVSPQGFNAGVLLNQLTDSEKEQIKLNEAMIEQLKNIKTEYEAQLKVAKLLEGLGLTKIEAEEKVKDLLKEQKKIAEEILAVGTKPSRAPQNRPAYGAGMTPLYGPENATTLEITEEFKTIEDLSRHAANALRSDFIDAWEDIFGQANSLFEKFLANIVSSLADLAAQSISSSIFGFLGNLIFPGAGTAMAALGKTTQVVNVNLGDEPLARVVVKGQEQAQRLRLL